MKKSTICLLVSVFVVSLLVIGLGVYTSFNNSIGGIQTHAYKVSKTHYLTEDKKDSLVLELSYDYPTYIPANDSVIKSIQTSIKEELFGHAFSDLKPDFAIECYATWLYADYINTMLPLKQEWEADADATKSSHRSVVEDEGPMFCEEVYTTGTIAGVHNNILSYSMDNYTYSGGVHGLSVSVFFNYDMKTGQPIHEENILRDGYFEPLRQMLISALINQTDSVEDENGLGDYGYSIEDIVPNDNFYVSEQGMCYVYNPYDIAPYALGITEILIPWSDLDSLLIR